MFRHISVTFMIIVLLVFTSYKPAQSVELILVDGKAAIQENNEMYMLPEDKFRVEQAQNAPMRFIAVDTDGDYNIRNGLYIFNEQGRQTAFIDNVKNGMCAAVSFAPDKKRVAVDSGTFIVRDWAFYAYPEMKPLNKHILYYEIPDIPGLRWIGDDEVLFNAINTESTRVCDYDPCGPVSVERLNLSTGQISSLKKGTPLCDWILLDVQDNQAILGKRCQPSAEDWKASAFDGPLEKMSISLQEHSRP